jgi:heme-degrading monooxygenase HmoA
MIARIWHGYALPVNADRYEDLLRAEILPNIHRIPGFQGSYLLRRTTGPEIEFVTITMWDSTDSIRAFAGEDFEAAVVLPEAQKLLTRFDPRSVHYDSVWCP